MFPLPVEFANPRRKGGSGKCHRSFCIGKRAYCIQRETCCTCRCNSGFYFNSWICVRFPITQPVSTTSPMVSSTVKSRTTKQPSVASTSSTKATTKTTVATTRRETSTKHAETSTPSAFKSSRSNVYSSSTPATRRATKHHSGFTSTGPASAQNPPASQTLPSSSTGSTSTTKKLTTTVSPGAKEEVVADTSSNIGLIVGLCFGILAIIICVLLLLYLRRGKKKAGGLQKFSKELCQVDLNGLYGASPVDSPTSPSYDYAFCDSPTGAGAPSQAMGNPVYSNKLHISESFENGQGANQLNDEQPVYHELVNEQVYADPTSGHGHEDTPQNEPIYRVVEEEALDSPIYREVEEPPLYAETTETPSRADGGAPAQYQELNYSTRKSVYQPLEEDWKSKKFTG